MAEYALPAPSHRFELTMADGARIAVRRHGNPDGLRFVISHGNGFAVDAYYPFWGQLTARYDVVVFDFRNYGESPFHGPGGHDMDGFVDDLVRIRDGIAAELGDRTSIGAFHSLSARANMKRTIDHGALWDALILFDPPMVPPPGHPARKAVMDEAEKLRRWAETRQDRYASPETLAEQFRASRTLRNLAPGAAELIARSILRHDGDSWVLRCPGTLESRIYHGNTELNLWKPVSAYDCPVMLICGDPDQAAPPPTSVAGRALAREFGYPYASIPGTGHFLQLEKPAECVRVMLEFLRSRGFDV